jgi:methionyl aminopeptidase
MKPVDLDGMLRAGQAAAETLALVGRSLRAGMSTADIDRIVRDDTARKGGIPSQLGYHGFPAAVCTSRNAVVCHGIPSEHEILRDGDILNVDVTTELGGWHGDCSATFFIGSPSAQARHLVDTARRCRDAGIAAIVPGGHIGDIGAAIMEVAAKARCSIVEDYGGHGIGVAMHLPPHIHHIGIRGRGPRLRAGMAITVEPMLNLGGATVMLLDDEWTVVTADGSLSAQFEHTIVITQDGPVITTRGDAENGGHVMA